MYPVNLLVLITQRCQRSFSQDIMTWLHCNWWCGMWQSTLFWYYETSCCLFFFSSGSQKVMRRSQHARKETEFLRLKRTRLGLDDFESLKVIGRGAFGEVCSLPLVSCTCAYHVHPVYPSHVKNSILITNAYRCQTLVSTVMCDPDDAYWPICLLLPWHRNC